jgi:hypothetical protein
MKNEWNRREFLQNTSAATIAALGMSSPIASLMADPTSPLAKKAATDVNLVNLESENLAKVTLSEVNYWAKKIFKEGKSNTLIYKKA